MPDPDLTPAQDESVRALLAAARHTDPAPPHVVARLDDTLADLLSQRREVRAPVITLASRRRRVASTALLAAAAVVVLGVGVTEVLPSLNESGNDSADSSAGAVEDQASSAKSEGALSADDPDAGAEGSAGDSQSRRSPAAAAETLGSLTSASALKPQVLALRPGPAIESFSAAPTCPVPAAGAAAQVAITYNGQPGALVYRAPVDGRQRVQVYLCGEAGPRRSVQISAE